MILPHLSRIKETKKFVYKNIYQFYIKFHDVANYLSLPF